MYAGTGLKNNTYTKNRSKWSDDQEWDLKHCGPNHTQKCQDPFVRTTAVLSQFGSFGQLHCRTFGHCNIQSRAHTEIPNANASHHHHTVHCLPIQANNPESSKILKDSSGQHKLGHAWTTWAWAKIPCEFFLHANTHIIVRSSFGCFCGVARLKNDPYSLCMSLWHA